MLMITIAAVAMAAEPAPAATKQGRYDTYVGARYGTHASFPGGIFRLQRESDNGDGATFASRDGAVLLVYATPNPDELPVREYLRMRIAGESGTVTYRHAGLTYAVMSGRRGDRTFYQRFEFDGMGGVVHSYRLEYPTRLQRRYGPIIARISLQRG